MVICVKNRWIWLGCSVFLLSACGSSHDSMDLARAMPPPNFDSGELSREVDPVLMAYAQSMDEKGVLGGSGQELGIETSKIIKSCGIKDKFDTDSLLAYQMDEGRLSFDVDGLNHASTKIERVYLNYTVSLQPELEKRDPCRYASAYQGILGSAYSELVVHEGENMYKELDNIQAEVAHVLAAFTD